MKCDSSNAVTLSMQTAVDGQTSERETLLERALGTTRGGGPNRRSVCPMKFRERWSLILSGKTLNFFGEAINFPGIYS